MKLEDQKHIVTVKKDGNYFQIFCKCGYSYESFRSDIVGIHAEKHYNYWNKKEDDKDDKNWRLGNS